MLLDKCTKKEMIIKSDNLNYVAVAYTVHVWTQLFYLKYRIYLKVAKLKHYKIKLALTSGYIHVTFAGGMATIPQCKVTVLPSRAVCDLGGSTICGLPRWK